MRSSYKKLGSYIREINNRNKDLSISNLLGINIDKFFMPSVANIVGTDLSKYKIVKKGQFACNRMHVGRDKRLPVALSKSDEDFIVSPAYNVFEIIDENKLLPEYLMMWFSRQEFDRNAWFYTDADVRQGLHWEAFCNMQLPVPDITKQQEIIDEYNTIKDRISLNKSLIYKLEETAQAVYRQWFVDFEFPDKNGNPYKSSGGEMEFCEELEKEVPRGWKMEKIKTMLEIQSGYSFSSDDYCVNGKYGLVTIENVKDGIFIDKCKNNIENIKKNMPDHCVLNKGDMILSLTGNIGRIAIVYGSNFLLNQRVGKIKLLNDEFYSFIYFLFRQDEFRNYLISISRGTAQLNLSPIEMQENKILVPKDKILIAFNEYIKKIIDQEVLLMGENSKLNNFLDLILSKMASEG